MKLSFLAALWIVPTLGIAEEKATPKAPQPALVHPSEAPRAWLGLRVSKPDETVTAHLPSLPPGVGFLIKKIDAGGPAELAGLREFDLVWKLGDQILVNEGQLAALLRLSKPGDEISLATFRAGQSVDIKLKLGQAPPLEKPFAHELVEASILPGESIGPMRVVNVAEKSASYSAEDGRATIQREGEEYRVTILDPQEKVIFEGNFPPDDSFEKVPDGWRRRVFALRRGLDQTLNGRLGAVREPRPRVVPPVAPKP